jgi:choline-glycine betaine transporter
MAIFIARISRGRSIRQIVLMLAIFAPIVTTFWFTIVGGSGIAFELADKGSVAQAFEGFNLPAALLAITNQLPAGFLISVLFPIMTYIFVATTGDSMTFRISRSMTNLEHPKAGLRVFWGIAMGLMAVILITVGSGGVSALQSFIVVTAVPVSLILLPSLWDAPRVTFRRAAERRVAA